jgi:hypothetical protein
MSLALKAAAIPFADVTPFARMGSIVAVSFLALSSALTLRALTAFGWNRPLRCAAPRGPPAFGVERIVKGRLGAPRCLLARFLTLAAGRRKGGSRHRPNPDRPKKSPGPSGAVVQSHREKRAGATF